MVLHKTELTLIDLRIKKTSTTYLEMPNDQTEMKSLSSLHYKNISRTKEKKKKIVSPIYCPVSHSTNNY